MFIWEWVADTLNPRKNWVHRHLAIILVLFCVLSLGWAWVGGTEAAPGQEVVPHLEKTAQEKDREFEIKKWAALLTVIHCGGKDARLCNEQEAIKRYEGYLRSVDTRDP